ncbi:MAG TPA: 3-hydroxybutyrate oligomer hydrolase family protein [Burkholderiaceae bacterium]|nr:3-hydroxybutyrate oligomer hydrolase family protein [Burkholderiaceae bacterium]
MTTTRFARSALALATLALFATACGGGGMLAREQPQAGKPNENANLNFKPAWLGAIRSTEYDGSSNDLLTAGLGKAGLGAAAAPAISTPATASELRRLAIHTNYRAIVDTTANGGYGSLYGPNVGVDGVAGSGDGKIAGSEHIAYADDGTGRQNVTLMVQVPSSFDPKNACIVSATSSGSRGVYGAIGSAGEWGLKRGCAVAYSDKGTGNGVHDLQNDTVNGIDGVRGSATALGTASNFTARLTPAERSAFNLATPNRFAVKHAHSEQNPEKDWGRDTLRAIEFAFYVLNERYSTRTGTGLTVAQIRPHNTLVIASSVSNGAGAALAAAEQDDAALIDGVAVSEPNVQLGTGPALRIERSGLPAYTAGSRPLYDYFSYANLLQPCAALAAGAAGSPFGYTGGTAFVAGNRCNALAAAGLVSGATTQERADNALARLQAYGWEPDANLLHASHFLFASPAIAVTYANAHGRGRVSEHLCGFSFAAVDGTGAVAPANPALVNGVFGTGNGVPPSGATIGLVYNNAVGGARSHTAATSPSTGALDFAFDGANCLRQLWTGTGPEAARVQAGVAEVAQRSANLRGKPAIVVHGRNDTLVPVNFSSRPYVLRNAQVEGSASNLRYIEVANAQHFDAFLPFAGYDTRYVPLHLYFIRAMDAMWAHLKNGTALPASQLVRTTPRGGTPGAATPIAPSNVPPIAAVPAAGDAIVIEGGVLKLPN